jgi:hypothetical protein
MKIAVIVTFLLFSCMARSQSYELAAVSHVSSNGDGLTFTKKDGSSFSGVRLRIFKDQGTWFGREALGIREDSKVNIFEIEVLKDDENVIIFRYPVVYSGIATISIMKKAGRYYFTEISYSNVLGSQNYTIEEGSFTSE